MSDIAKAREKGARTIKPGARRNPKNQFNDSCDNCGGKLPCRSAACLKKAAAGRRGGGTAAAPKAKKAKLSWGEQRSIKKAAMDAYRAKHPTARPGKIKSEGNKAVRAAKNKLK